MKDIQFNERKQHGQTDFPFQYYYIDNTHPHYVMPLHWHGEFELIRVISGRFELFLDNKNITLHSGDCAIIDCTTLHRGTPANAVYECVVFSLSMLYKKSNDIIRKYIRPIAHRNVGVSAVPTSRITEQINAVFTVAKAQTPLYELKLHSLLFEFFLLLYEDSLIINQQHSHSKQMEIISELLHWIDKNYTDTITLYDLSRLSGLNQKYLCRFFKEYTGKTPIDYINYLRIEAACHEMQHSGLSVTDAALESGFNSISYFTKAFKKYKGITPREYKASL